MNIKFKTKSFKAQTMVEFALILPILMLVVIGLLEVGRMVFTYISIASASREAVRYGSASGIDKSGYFQRYLDCDGIRAAAEKVDVLNVITDIRISYDHGPDGPSWDTSKFGSDQCDGTNTTKINACEPGSDPLICYTDRINVEVDGLFEPILNYIPIESRSITSTNSHTLLDKVDIEFATIMYPTRTPFPTITIAPSSTPKKLPTPTLTPTGGPLPTPECVINSNDPYISDDYSTIYWELINDNSFDLVIKNIYITWPDGSGTLTEISIDSVAVFTGNLPPPSQNISLSNSLSTASHLFSFKFQNNPLSGLFQVTVSFQNDKCSIESKSLTVYPVTHSGSVPGTLPSSTITGPWTLTNHTESNLEIASIEITFPCANLNDILGLDLGFQYWSGSGYASSCVGTIITPSGFFLPPGSTDMTLIFNNKNIDIITAKVTLQCFGTDITTVCETVDSTNMDQLTPP